MRKRRQQAPGGIRFLVDASGARTAVLIDLEDHGDIWEDFYDGLVAAERASAPRETLASVKARLHRRWRRSRGG